MRAVVFDKTINLINDYPHPKLDQGWAIIRPTLVGICATDHEITRGYKNFHGVLGHEFVGIQTSSSRHFGI